MLGYAALAGGHRAHSAFERAISLEPDNPLARLGLGLTRIRQGHLPEGRREIEIAAALSPENPIVRSYLGKAYFDERRETESGAQYETAQKLDPLDPTPWFYDAIRKQTINRPVEALQDFEKAIDLNDNRAVYRSGFLLDQDLAARSSSLGRLYRDLGFEQLAPVEGWKSLDADPSDYSGHRLLADTYSALPLHEVARVSELLQAQLLAPISLTPVPAHLAETDLFILERAGPNAAGFNEFNPLFNRNRLALEASGALGQESILGDEVTVSGVWNRLSFSAGQFHYDSDGLGRITSRRETRQRVCSSPTLASHVGARRGFDPIASQMETCSSTSIPPTSPRTAQLRRTHDAHGSASARLQQKFPDNRLCLLAKPGLRLLGDECRARWTQRS
jgi:tetratricopeptide (TPR) repeat protein